MLIPDEAATRVKDIVDRLVNTTEKNLIEGIVSLRTDPSRSQEMKELFDAFLDALRAKAFVEENISVTREETAATNLLLAANIVSTYLNDASAANVNRVLIGTEVEPALMKELEKWIGEDDRILRSEAGNVLKFIERTPEYAWDYSDSISRGVKIFKLVNDTAEFDEILESDSGFKELTSDLFQCIRIACKKECVCYHTHDQIDEIRQKLSICRFPDIERYNQAIEILHPDSEHKVTYYIYVPE